MSIAHYQDFGSLKGFLVIKVTRFSLFFSRLRRMTNLLSASVPSHRMSSCYVPCVTGFLGQTKDNIPFCSLFFVCFLLQFPIRTVIRQKKPGKTTSSLNFALIKAFKLIFRQRGRVIKRAVLMANVVGRIAVQNLLVSFLCVLGKTF